MQFILILNTYVVLKCRLPFTMLFPTVRLSETLEPPWRFWYYSYFTPEELNETGQPGGANQSETVQVSIAQIIELLLYSFTLLCWQNPFN